MHTVSGGRRVVPPIRASVLVALAVVTGSLAACVGGDGDDGSPPVGAPREPARTTQSASRPTEPIDPCALITRSEAQRVAGRALHPRRERRLRLGIETCARVARDTGVFVTRIDTARSRRRFLAETRRVPGVVRVRDLGDAAVWGEKTGCIRTLSRGVDFSVCGRRDGRPLGFSVLRSLTRSALARLG